MPDNFKIKSEKGLIVKCTKKKIESFRQFWLWINSNVNTGVYTASSIWLVKIITENLKSYSFIFLKTKFLKLDKTHLRKRISMSWTMNVSTCIVWKFNFIWRLMNKNWSLQIQWCYIYFIFQNYFHSGRNNWDEACEHVWITKRDQNLYFSINFQMNGGMCKSKWEREKVHSPRRAYVDNKYRAIAFKRPQTPIFLSMFYAH